METEFTDEGEDRMLDRIIRTYGEFADTASRASAHPQGITFPSSKQ